MQLPFQEMIAKDTTGKSSVLGIRKPQKYDIDKHIDFGIIQKFKFRHCHLLDVYNIGQIILSQFSYLCKDDDTFTSDTK
jgi:hypothetical protein